MPRCSSSSSRRSSVVSSSTWLPSAVRGCGSNVTTVGVSAARERPRRARGDGRGGRRRTCRSRPPRGRRRARARPDDVRRRPFTRAVGRAPRRRDRPLGVGLVDRERPDLRPAQRPAVAAERLGDRPDVGAGADAQVERDGARRVYAMTSSASTGERRSGISTATPRRCRRYARSPPILTADAAGIGSSTSPRRASSRSSSSARAGGSCRSSDLPLRVAGRRLRGQVDVGHVALVELDERSGQLSCRSGQHDQQPRRERVECPGMTRPARRCGGAPRPRPRRTRSRPACRSGRSPPARAPAGVRLLTPARFCARRTRGGRTP